MSTQGLSKVCVLLLLLLNTVCRTERDERRYAVVPVPTGVLQIYLLRHAETNKNVHSHETFQGDPEALTPKGRVRPVPPAAS